MSKPKTPVPKPWYKSKLFWFNVLSGVAAIVVANFNLIQEMVNPKYYLALIGLVNGINIGLRFITTSPVYVKQLDKEYTDALNDTNRQDP